MHAIKIKNLNKIYKNGIHALKDVNLEVACDNFFALLGANGAGKTTIIGIITGLVKKTSGKVHIFGYDLDNRSDAIKAKKKIGVVPQEFNFNIFERVQDILITQAGYFGIKKKVAIDESEILLRRLGLWDKRNDQSQTLSGGMKRRLMIARALIHQPELLILDEPTAGVDVELRHGMWEYLRELNSRSTTILLTTHYLEEVEQMCQHAAIIKEGEIVHHDKVINLIDTLDKVTYVITVKRMEYLDHIKHFKPIILDNNTFEVEISRRESLKDFIDQLSNINMLVTDIRPKENRLEKLFLNILNQ